MYVSPWAEEPSMISTEHIETAGYEIMKKAAIDILCRYRSATLLCENR